MGVKYVSLLLIAVTYSMTAVGVAHANGPVGGSEGPGDPSLLVTYPAPSAAANVSEPTKPEPVPEQKTVPEPSRKDG